MKKIIVIILIAVVILSGIIYFPQLKLFWTSFKNIISNLAESERDISELIQKEVIKGDLSVQQGPLKLPLNFSISIFAKGLGSPRVMTRDPLGNLLVSITSQGKVVALPDKNGDGISDKVVTVASGLYRPHGLAIKCDRGECKLYIAESNQVAVYDYDEENLKAVNKKKIAGLPGGGNHFTRTIIFMPYPDQDRLLVSVGSSCDVCEETDWRRAKILSVDLDGGDLRNFAEGLRNSVFMAIHPVTGKIWATEMGRDWLGDDLPPDEINIIEEGEWYGWPWFYGKNIEDNNFSPRSRPGFAREPSPSFINIPAHSAPLGLAFFPEEGWPEEYWHNLLVAYHGSWNRSAPTGYKIVRYILDEKGNYLGEEDFISGWLTEKGEILGRPVDILIQPSGIIYISDDKAGIIYRVDYKS